MRASHRAYVPTLPPRAPYISEAEVFARTLTAIRTLKAMPDRERRFLAAGSKIAWVQVILERGDENAQASTDFEPLQRVIKKHRAPRQELAPEPPPREGPPLPQLARDGILANVAKRSASLETHAAPLENRPDGSAKIAYQPASVAPCRDEEQPRERVHLKRADIDDALVAGEWFAKLALLPVNIDEFEKRVEGYRTGVYKSPQVDDQRLLTLYSQGWSLKLIGQRFGWNEHQTERRFNEIARNLFLIANKTARYADLHRIQKLNRERVSV